MAKIPNGLTLAEILPPAQAAGYAIPAFSTRHRKCIGAAFGAAVAARSPVIIEISQRELGVYELSPKIYREELDRVLAETKEKIPFALHLDHSQNLDLIRSAIEAGFTSVMIDASAKPFAENVAATREVVEIAHAAGVSVEAELGKLTDTHKMETDSDEEMYTDPAEAGEFVRATGCDALAVSIGTAHGNYPVKSPRIDFERLDAIRKAIGKVPIVLHGGSGLPPETVRRAMGSPGGGVSKMNIATDLEDALREAMGGLPRMTSAQLDAQPPELVALGLAAVRRVATEKIKGFVRSDGRA